MPEQILLAADFSTTETAPAYTLIIAPNHRTYRHATYKIYEALPTMLNNMYP
jgi:hypothetical protein